MKLELDKKTKKYKRFDDPMQLIDVAVMEASSVNAPAGWLNHMTVTKVTTQNVQQDPKTGLKSVHAIGEGVLKTHRLSDDSYFGGKPAYWEIQFKEDYDELGVPDLKCISYDWKY